jgi:hypothetical protein
MTRPALLGCLMLSRSCPYIVPRRSLGTAMTIPLSSVYGSFDLVRGPSHYSPVFQSLFKTTAFRSTDLFCSLIHSFL